MRIDSDHQYIQMMALAPSEPAVKPLAPELAPQNCQASGAFKPLPLVQE